MQDSSLLIYKYIHGGHIIGGEGHTPRASAVLVFTVQEIWIFALKHFFIATSSSFLPEPRAATVTHSLELELVSMLTSVGNIDRHTQIWKELLMLNCLFSVFLHHCWNITFCLGVKGPKWDRQSLLYSTKMAAERPVALGFLQAGITQPLLLTQT